MDCENLKDLTIGKNVEFIGGSAFNNCTNLENIKFGEKLTEIGLQAFHDTKKITSIEFPSSVKHINKEAFNGFYGSSLTSVKFNTSKPISIGKDVFHDDCYANASLYVPKGSKDRYEETYPYFLFKNIIEFDASGTNSLSWLESKSILVKSLGNTIIVEGDEIDEDVEFYGINGQYLGSEKMVDGQASFDTNLDMLIVKVGEKSIKIKK